MKMSQAKAGEVLAVLGDMLAGVAPIVGGVTGAGLSGAARIVRTASALLISGRSVEDVLSQMKQPPVLTKPWHEDATTSQETPGSKASKP